MVFFFLVFLSSAVTLGYIFISKYLELKASNKREKKVGLSGLGHVTQHDLF